MAGVLHSPQLAGLVLLQKVLRDKALYILNLSNE